MIADKRAMIAAGVIVGAALLWANRKGASGVGAVAGGAAVDLVGGVLSGGVIAIGDAVGVPRTNEQQAAIDRANGDIWSASASMPAGEWIKWVFSGAPTGGASGSW